jgi:hypothetical protein
MIFAALLLALAQDANRLTYLDESDPYYVHRKFPKLITPQWIGEEGVEAAIILAIDDMRGHEKWETYLRPILERLKKIDGRAPVSIMTCTIDPNHPHLQKWLKEGLSIEVHTVDHPCPLLKDGSLPKAKSTYDRCVDLMNLVPNNKPVAFRMPCCDSLNTPSPRFFAEIFNRTTPNGKFLTIDTSVFNLTTSADPDLPRDLVVDADGKDKIRKYVPFPSFVNTIENYPYPYQIGRLCWEFPCGAPSDWEGFNIQKAGHATTIADMKAMIDAAVIKQGVFSFVFHPYNWILPEQMVEIIDHVVEKHGKKVKFLTFREAQERLDKNMLGGHPLRRPDGGDNLVRLLDIDNDGYMDAITGGPDRGTTRRWDPQGRTWVMSDFPVPMTDNVHFGILGEKFPHTVLLSPDGWYDFLGGFWVKRREEPPLEVRDKAMAGDLGIRLRDLDGDGRCEMIVANSRVLQVYRETDLGWKLIPHCAPPALVDTAGRDRGVRFVDLNGDGRADIVVSNDSGWQVYLFKDLSSGWEQIARGAAGSPGSIPMITRNSTNNGAWFHSKHLWVQNEDTAKMKDLVDRRSFEDLLRRD